MPHLSVLAPGQLTTVQDAGRWGSQGLGVSPGGAADTLALRVGNWLAGNAEDAAALEITWAGPCLAFAGDTLIALTGAAAEAACGGAPVPGWCPVWMAAGSVLEIAVLSAGARAYLCVQGGIQVASVLGGRGTDLRNHFGGLDGRPLVRDDTLVLMPQPRRYPHLHAALAQCTSGFAAPSWQVSMWRDTAQPSAAPIRLLPGPDQERLSPGQYAALFSTHFEVQARSDRQALRLGGPTLDLRVARRRSAGVCRGVLQLPPDGHPILLLSDYQTTGGYPVIGVAAGIEAPRLAQLRPGDRLHFRPCTLADAHRLLAERERRLGVIRREVTARWTAG
jgi:antagonist of KipI